MRDHPIDGEAIAASRRPACLRRHLRTPLRGDPRLSAPSSRPSAGRELASQTFLVAFVAARTSTPDAPIPAPGCSESRQPRPKPPPARDSGTAGDRGAGAGAADRSRRGRVSNRRRADARSARRGARRPARRGGRRAAPPGLGGTRRAGDRRCPGDPRRHRQVAPLACPTTTSGRLRLMPASDSPAPNPTAHGGNRWTT